MIRQAIFVLGVLLCGCVAEAPEFVTTQDVALRARKAEDSPVVAWLPRGTPVVPAGPVSSECQCWKVGTYAGSGWLFTRFIEGPGVGAYVPPSLPLSGGSPGIAPIPPTTAGWANLAP